jgi:creatinine amidohydrolase/Fe(II)-dependent formamide hydrolase-like protein
MTAKLRKSSTADGRLRTVYIVGSFQELAPYGGWGDPTCATVKEGLEELEIAAKHTMAIIKAIMKIKVPLKSHPIDNIEQLKTKNK